MDDSYYQEWNSTITALSTAKGALQEEAFFETASETLIDMGELSEANYAQYKKTGLQIDGYGGNLIDEENVLKLILLDYCSNQNNPETLTQTEIQAIVRRGLNFLRKVLTRNFINEIEESSDVFKLAGIIRERWKDIQKVRFILVTNKLMSERVKENRIKLEEIEDTAISLNIWDYRRFSDINAQGNEREPLIINMEEFENDIAVLPINLEHGRFRSFLAVVPGTVLADIYDLYGTRLLEQNVRVYLQAKGKINQGIQNTILDEPDMFFSYNNGLTATAEKLDIEESSSGLRIRTIHNFQIVNGGQTMASIYQMSPYCKKKWKKGIAPDITNVYVQMKISVIPPDETLEVVPKISRFSNSQNKVSDADFFSNHPYHVRIEEFSRRIVAPAAGANWSTTKWYYERMRGQYNNERNLLSDSQKRKFENLYPSNQKITKTDLAKYLMPWYGKPDVAQKGAAKCFAEFATKIEGFWEKDSDFCNETYFKECIVKAIVFKQLEKIISGQPWYQGGGTRAPIVIHTIGKLAHDLNKAGLVFPFQSIWNSQKLPTAIEKCLSTLSTSVSKIILNPPTPGHLETEWAKTAACTDTIAKEEFAYPQAFLEVMENKSDYLDDVIAAKKDEKLNGSVQAQAFVYSQNAEFWNDLIAWGETRGELNYKDVSIIRSAIEQRSTEKQCDYIFRMFTKCKAAGFSTQPQTFSSS